VNDREPRIGRSVTVWDVLILLAGFAAGQGAMLAALGEAEVVLGELAWPAQISLGLLAGSLGLVATGPVLLLCGRLKTGRWRASCGEWLWAVTGVAWCGTLVYLWRDGSDYLIQFFLGLYDIPRWLAVSGAVAVVLSAAFLLIRRRHRLSGRAGWRWGGLAVVVLATAVTFAARHFFDAEVCLARRLAQLRSTADVSAWKQLFRNGVAEDTGVSLPFPVVFFDDPTISRYVEPIHVAVMSGSPDAVTLLLDRGVGVNARAYDGRTALHAAASAGRVDLVALLLDRGADPAARTDYGYTPLSLAASSGSREMVRLLVSRGAPVNGPDLSGATALNEAVRKGDVELVVWLLDHGADVNARGSTGLAPLHLAVSWYPSRQREHLPNLPQMENASLTRLLLERGANPNVRTPSGDAPLHWAAFRPAVEHALLLIEGGADVNARNSSRETPLFRAVYGGKQAMAALLVSHGADPSLTGSSGNTPADEAAEQGHRSLADWLRKQEAGRAGSASQPAATLPSGRNGP